MSELSLDEDSRAVIERLVAEKQRLLEQSAPRISLQPYLAGEPGAADMVLQQLASAAGSPLQLACRPAACQPCQPAAESAESCSSSGLVETHTLCQHGALAESAAHARGSATWNRRSTRCSKPKPPSPRQACTPRLPAHAQQRAERVSLEARAREQAECTFRPTIRPYVPPPPPPPPPQRPPGPREPAQPTRQGGGGFDGESFFERNQQWHREREEERRARQAAAEEAELAECTFHPEVVTHTKLRRTSSMPRMRSGEKHEDAASNPAARRGSVETPVYERLYQPDARARYLEEAERKRRAAEAAEEEECTFHPVLNRPGRANSAVADVPSRWRSTPSKTDRLKAVEAARIAEATNSAKLASGGTSNTDSGLESGRRTTRSFSPRVNKLPRSLSHAAADYLTEPAHVRLSRAPSSRPASPAAPRALRRSASAPRQRTTPSNTMPLRAARVGAHGDTAGTNLGLNSGVSNDGPARRADEAFASFLERQAEYARRRDDARVRSTLPLSRSMPCAQILQVLPFYHLQIQREIDSAVIDEERRHVRALPTSDRLSTGGSPAFFRRLRARAQRHASRQAEALLASQVMCRALHAISCHPLSSEAY